MQKHRHRRMQKTGQENQPLPTDECKTTFGGGDTESRGSGVSIRLPAVSTCLAKVWSAPVWQMFRKVFEFKMGCLQSAPVDVILHFWIIVSEYLMVGLGENI